MALTYTVVISTIASPAPLTPPPITTAIPFLNNSSNSSCSSAQVSAEKVLYSIFMMFLLLLSLLGNSVVSLAVCFAKRLGERPTFYFISSLACSDMVIATFTVPFRIFFVLKDGRCFSVPLCYIFHLMTTFGNITSILNLFLVSTDRFIAVHFPYKYPTLLTKGRAKRIICMVWMMTVCWSLLGTVRWAPSSPDKPFFVDMCAQDNVNYHLAVFGFYAVILVIMSIQYVDIMQAVLRQIRAIEKNTPKFQPSPECYRSKFQPSPQQSPNEYRRDSNTMWTHTHQVYAETARMGIKKVRPRPLKSRLRKEIKATKTIVLVFLAFCLCWLPGLIFTMMHYIDERSFVKLGPTTTAVLYFAFVDIFPVINTMVNPIIYSFSNTHFRNSLEDVWRKLKSKAPQRLRMYSTSSSGARVSSSSTSTTSTTLSSRMLSIDQNIPPVNV